MTATDEVSPSLSELAERLRANGTVVVPFKDYVEIRLPLFASVRVSIVDGRLLCDPRFGFIPRDRATWASLIGVAAVTVAFFLDYGVGPFSVALGFLGVSSTGSMAIRYQLTESCITRVQTAWMLMAVGGSTALAPREVQRELGEGPPEIVRPRTKSPTPTQRDHERS
jgi:hypothetical protein